MPLMQVGVSACLLGQRVRYDGAHRTSALVTNALAAHINLVSFCPEVEIGLGVPRPPVRLVGDPAQPRMLGVEDASLDVTTRMAAFGTEVGARLMCLSGFILKARSPSCGINDVPVFDEAGLQHATGAGLFARAVARHAPLLPLVDEGQLARDEVRDHFFERVFAYYRWCEQVMARSTLADLRAFHVAHKTMLLAHDEPTYRLLGPWLAAQRTVEGAAEAYGARFFAALQRPVTRGSHANVVQHLLGFFKKVATVGERKSASDVLQNFRDGAVDIGAVLYMLRELNARYPNKNVQTQKYLYPEPAEVALRFSEWDARSCVADK